MKKKTPRKQRKADEALFARVKVKKVGVKVRIMRQTWNRGGINE